MEGTTNLAWQTDPTPLFQDRSTPLNSLRVRRGFSFRDKLNVIQQDVKLSLLYSAVLFNDKKKKKRKEEKRTEQNRRKEEEEEEEGEEEEEKGEEEEEEVQQQQQSNFYIAIQS